MTMNVIAISGHARHGKDTVAEMLQERLREKGHRVLITHYADLLKHICKEFFGWDGKKDDKGRSLLQYVGTDVIRKTKPDFWVDFVTDVLGFFGGCWDFVIIPDARFPNEIERLKESGMNTIHLKVDRPGFDSILTKEQKSHISETSLDNMEPDYCVVNDGDLDTLKAKIDELVEISEIIQWRWAD